MYTPGPWTYSKLHPDGALIKRHGTFEVNTPNYAVCATLFTGGPIRNEDDARLIAAAPDLLEAAKAAVAALTQQAVYPADVDAAVGWLNAAIRKATE